jgi:RHS repeat-associated protein
MFTGRRFDYETGLYYYRARYYNPYIGRFLQTDPIGYGDGINWYAYCGNNPLAFIDPSGCWAYYDYEWVELPSEYNKKLKLICYDEDDSVANEYYFDSWDEMYNEVKEKIWDVCDVDLSFDFESWRWWYHWAHDYDQDLLKPVSYSITISSGKMWMYPWSSYRHIPDIIPSNPIPHHQYNPPDYKPENTRDQEQQRDYLDREGKGSSGAFEQEPKGFWAKLISWLAPKSGGAGATIIFVPIFYFPEYYQPILGGGT